MRKQVLINVEATDLRVAVLEDGTLTELFIEKFNERSILGNVYKGKVEGIVPGLKAVFVNIGLDRNAFLHFSDVLPEYELPVRGRPERLPPSKSKAMKISEEEFAAEESDDYIPPPLIPGDELDEEIEGNGESAKRPARRSRALHVGDSILVQVSKESIQRKGPRVTSHVSIPGRYLVMMPFSDHQGGVSRKIENVEERRRLRDLLRSLDTESGAFIIRTAGLEEHEDTIRDDHEALVKQWKAIKRKNLRLKAPALIRNEQETLQLLVRDTLRNDIDEILIDSRAEMKKLVKSCEAMAPAMVRRIHLFESSKNIFDVFEVEQQFQKALRRKVMLKSGGFLIIDETEALTAIDVNSGKYVGEAGQDEVVLKTNLEACTVVSRQLRLRDLGGLIVIDFIDMENFDHRDRVLREFRGCLKRDDARYAISGFSEFGLIEMTRKRVRMSLAHVMSRLCPYCEGTGRIFGESHIWKLIKYELIEELSKDNPSESVQISVHSQIKDYLAGEVLSDLTSIANRFGVKVEVVGKYDYHHEQYSIATQAKSKIYRGKRRASTKGIARARKGA